MRELKLAEARLETLPEVLAFIDGILEEMECSMKAQMQIDVVVEELYVNVAHYAYAPGTGPLTIQAEAGADRELTITFIDEGVPYDPLARPDPDITLSIEERPVGGLGIFMVKNTMDDMTYRREDDRNVLTIRKRV